MTYPAIHIRIFHVQARDPSPELLESLTARKAVETANANTNNPADDWGMAPPDFSKPESVPTNFLHVIDEFLEQARCEQGILDRAAQRMLSALLQKNNNVQIIPHVGFVVLPGNYLTECSAHPEDTFWQQMDHYACVSLAMVRKEITRADLHLPSDQPPAMHRVATLYTVCAYKDGNPVPIDEEGNTYFTLLDSSRHIYLPADPGTLPGVDDTSINPAKQPALKNTAYMGFTRRKPGAEPSAP